MFYRSHHLQSRWIRLKTFRWNSNVWFSRYHPKPRLFRLFRRIENGSLGFWLLKKNYPGKSWGGASYRRLYFSFKPEYGTGRAPGLKKNVSDFGGLSKTGTALMSPEHTLLSLDQPRSLGSARYSLLLAVPKMPLAGKFSLSRHLLTWVIHTSGISNVSNFNDLDLADLLRGSGQRTLIFITTWIKMIIRTVYTPT